MAAGISAAILCPGPSLSGFIAAPVTHDVYIGVNLAAQAFPCGWFVFKDRRALEEMPPLCRPILVTNPHAAEYMQYDAAVRAEWKWLTFDAFSTIGCPADTKWQHFTMTCAMVLAAYLGARHITLYGVDWRGDTYFDGSKAIRGGLHAARFAAEAARFAAVSAWLEDVGVSVTRVEGESQREAECVTARQ